MAAKKTDKKAPAKRRAPAKAKVEEVKKKDCKYIDRSNGVLLREKDLDKKKPWLSPISGQATVEKLTEEELEAL